MSLDDPHARMLITWLSTQDWLETIQDEPILLAEKLAIALRFFGDSELIQFINKLIREAKQHGELHGLILTGVNEDAIEILQAYVDNTGDVQTAAVISALAPQLYIRELYPPGHERNQIRTRSTSVSTTQSTDDGSTSSMADLSPTYDPHSETMRRVIQGWIDVYRDLLDRWRLFHHRSQFDIERGEVVALIMSPRQPEIVDEDEAPLGSTTSGIMPPSEWAPRHLEVVCQSCQQPIGWRGPKAGSMSLAQVIISIYVLFQYQPESLTEYLGDLLPEPCVWKAIPSLCGLPNAPDMSHGSTFDASKEHTPKRCVSRLPWILAG